MSGEPSRTGTTTSTYIFTAESVAAVTATMIYAKAFLETLGQRTGEGVAKRLGEVIHDRRSRGREREHLVGIEGMTAMIIVTADLPDEARLALLDLDVTAEEVRGKTLRWDGDAMAWRADSADSAEG
jgi:hypothetical protein